MKYILLLWVMLSPPHGVMVALTSIPSDDPACAPQIATLQDGQVDGYVCVPVSAVVGDIHIDSPR